MKTNLQKLFLLAIILWAPNLVQAASSCSYSEQVELNNIVANVKATYETVDILKGKVRDIDKLDENGQTPVIDYYVKGLDISILNITEDIFVKVNNKNTGEEKTFYYKDTNNGTVTFRTEDVSELNIYTIDVYSNKYTCAGEKFRTFTLQTPMYNRYSEFFECEGAKDFYYCQEFISSENVEQNAFNEKLKEYLDNKKAEEQQAEQEKNKNFIDKLADFYNNNKLIIYSVGIVIVVAGVATAVIFIKKKRSRVL